MQLATWFRRAGWPVVLGTIFVAGRTVAAQDDRPPEDNAPPRREAPRPPGDVTHPPGGPHERIRTIVRHIEPWYQLKISVARVPEALDAQLKLDGQGVLVTRVLKDGPADKAGVKAHDILLAADDKPLEGPEDLAKIATESEGREITLKLRRAGEESSVSVTPEKSPKGVVELDVDFHEIRDIERTIREKVKDLGVDLRMQVIEPGAWLPRGAEFAFGRRTDLPDDLSINIQKQGKEPAEIEVEKGDQKWTVKENDLAPLPEDVRKHVEGFLGRGPMRFNIVGQDEAFRFGVPRPPGPPHEGPAGPERADRPLPPRGDRPDRDGPGFDGPDERRFDGARDRIRDSVERRLDVMSRQMREMHERMESLQRLLREDDDRPDRPRRPDRPEQREEDSDKDEA